MQEEQPQKDAKRIQAETILFRRQQAYNAVFIKDAPVVLEVLEDLAEFCRATESTFHADARTHALLEGRREVWLHITKHLNLSSQRLWELKTKMKY